MYRIPSAKENIIMKVPQKIPIYTFSATLGHNGISIMIFLRHLLSSVFSPALGHHIFSSALPLCCTWGYIVYLNTDNNNFRAVNATLGGKYTKYCPLNYGSNEFNGHPLS